MKIALMMKIKIIIILKNNKMISKEKNIIEMIEN